jgi:DNA-binding response OmpR family regulator
VVGSDRGLLALVRAALPPARYVLEAADSAESGLGVLFARPPDLIVVTSRPDGFDGTATCRDLQTVAELPVIMLVPEGDTLGAVRGLTCADDYVALPVAPEEVEARVRAVLRRASRGDGTLAPAYDDGRLRVDFRDRVATLGGGPLPLTPTEYRLLALLAGSPRRVFPQRELLRRIWGDAYADDPHLLRLQVANLRKKVGDGYIRTHRGLGYSFQPS